MSEISLEERIAHLEQANEDLKNSLHKIMKQNNIKAPKKHRKPTEYNIFVKETIKKLREETPPNGIPIPHNELFKKASMLWREKKEKAAATSE